MAVIGVVKTHKLLLLNATLLTAPHIPDTFNESKLTIGPRAVRDILEHFPVARGPKSDPQLEWNFSEEEVHLRGLDASLDLSSKSLCETLKCNFDAHIVKGQLTTEAIIGAAEFEVYDIYDPPISIAFHLREFQVMPIFMHDPIRRLTCLHTGHHSIRRGVRSPARHALHRPGEPAVR